MTNEILRLEDVIQSENRNLSIEVNKQIEIEVDLGNLLAFDQNPLPNNLHSSNIERHVEFEAIARDSTQAIVNKLWACETQTDYDSVIAILPRPTELIPREKPVPKPRPPTKWEEFAKQKGIQKRKKETKVWDETSKSWKYAWGFRKKFAEKHQKDYDANLQEEMDREMGKDEARNKNPNTKKHLNKSERVAKNELNRLRNIARAKKGVVETGGVLPPPSMNRKYIPLKSESKKALNVATTSTASLGRFTEPLKAEKGRKGASKKLMITDRNAKEAVSPSKEKETFMKVFENLQNKKDAVDKSTAAKAFKGRQKNEVEEELGKKSLSKTQLKKREGAKSHAGRVSLSDLKKGKKKSGFGGGSKQKKGGRSGGGGKVTKKKGAVGKSGKKK